MDPLKPSATLLIKLGSAFVHAQEAMFEMHRGGIAAMQFDEAAFETLAKDPEVVEWMAAMSKMAFLPVKR
jgi:hypothetical protein